MNDILTEFNGKIVGKRGMKQKNVMCYLKNNKKFGGSNGGLNNEENVISRFNQDRFYRLSLCEKMNIDTNKWTQVQIATVDTEHLALNSDNRIVTVSNTAAASTIHSDR